jgi:hypothetical protein
MSTHVFSLISHSYQNALEDTSTKYIQAQLSHLYILEALSRTPALQDMNIPPPSLQIRRQTFGTTEDGSCSQDSHLKVALSQISGRWAGYYMYESVLSRDFDLLNLLLMTK